MAILDILNKPIFASRFKLPLHIITGTLVVIVIGLSVPRLFIKNQPRTRASTIALGMGAKSLVLLTYMVATSHMQALKRWHSYKANAIISCLEILFWGAVAGLVFQANLKRCTGVTCVLSWVTVGVAVVINNLEIYAAAIALREFREYRRIGSGVPISSIRGRGTDEEEMVLRFPPALETPVQGRRERRRAELSGYHAQVVRGKQ